MKSPRAQTSEELGQELRSLREAQGVSLEAIAAKTKISLQTLKALEDGALSRLPGATFARLFLRQYLEFLNEEPQAWLTKFEELWRKWESSSQPVPVVSAQVVKPKMWFRWVLGLIIVCAAGALVFWLDQRERPKVVAEPTPQTLLQELAPTPIPTNPPAQAEGTERQQTNQLIIETKRDCWIEWQVEGKVLLRQLVPPRQRLNLDVPAGGGKLLLGDGGAVTLRLGEVSLAPPGRDGEVLRLEVPWAPQERSQRL